MTKIKKSLLTRDTCAKDFFFVPLFPGNLLCAIFFLKSISGPTANEIKTILPELLSGKHVIFLIPVKNLNMILPIILLIPLHLVHGLNISQCFEGSEYFRTLEQLDNFDLGVLACENENAFPAEITTLKENNFIFNFLTNISETNQNAFFGLITDFNETSDPLNYKFFKSGRFLGTDPENIDFGINPGEPPWAVDTPRSINSEGSCVNMRMGDGGLWNNLVCDTNRRIICERPCVISKSPVSSVENQYQLVGFIGIALSLPLLLIVAAFLYKRTKQFRQLQRLTYF